MNTTAAATETAVQIGRGKTLHAQLKGVEGAAAMCGTISTRGGSTAERRVAGTVTCRKCLAQIAADEALEAAEAEEVHAAMLLEDVATEVAAEVEARRETTVPAAGDLLTHKSGAEYTMVSLSKDGKCYRVKNEEGKASYIRIAQFI